MALCARLAATTVQVSEEFIDGHVLAPRHLGATFLEGAQLPSRRRVHGHASDAKCKLGLETEPHRFQKDL